MSIRRGEWIVVAVLSACGNPIAPVSVEAPAQETASPTQPAGVARLQLTRALTEQGGDVVVTRIRGDAPVTQELRLIAPGTQTLEVSLDPSEDLHLLQRSVSRQALASTVQQGGCQPGPEGHVSSDVLRVPEDFPTIQAAIDASQAGDTVLVGPGTWAESVRLKSGVALTGSGATQTILDARGAAKTLVDFTGAQDVSISGFTFRGVGFAATCGRDVLGCSGNWYAAAIYADGHELAGVDQPRVKPVPTSSLTTCADSSAHIAHNVFEGNAIAVLPYFHALAVVENNLFVGNDNAYVANHLQDRGVVMNNTFYGSSASSVSITAGSVDVLNNLIVKSQASALYQEYIQVGWVRGNLVFERDPSLPLAMTIGVDGNIETDPLLRDPSTGDFHLATGSPAIDSGWDMGGRLTDADGSPPDMGAWGGPGGSW